LSALRRWIDVALTLVPLLIAVVVTLEICVLTGLAAQFCQHHRAGALLGVGVAFKIYYIIAWRSGERNFCNRAYRARSFSAPAPRLPHSEPVVLTPPGTSSMGKADGAVAS